MRADQLLFKLGFARSRENAKKLIADGAVNINGKTVQKPSEDFDEASVIELKDNVINKYVSRGGLKLEHAITEFGIDVKGMTALDIGASTGGFTDCLLKNGAALVYAVDVGTGQLHPDIFADKRVISIESCNAREPVSEVKEKCDIVVMDVSFISQTLLYKTVCHHLADGGIFISLIKPQFEAGRENLSSGGIVKSEKVRLKVIENLRNTAFSAGLEMKSCVASPITGGDGNTEYLAFFKKRGVS